MKTSDSPVNVIHKDSPVRASTSEILSTKKESFSPSTHRASLKREISSPGSATSLAPSGNSSFDDCPMAYNLLGNFAKKIGTPEETYYRQSAQTRSGLTHKDLTISKRNGKIVSRKKAMMGKFLFAKHHKAKPKDKSPHDSKSSSSSSANEVLPQLNDAVLGCCF